MDLDDVSPRRGVLEVVGVWNAMIFVGGIRGVVTGNMRSGGRPPLLHGRTKSDGGGGGFGNNGGRGWWFAYRGKGGGFRN